MPQVSLPSGLKMRSLPNLAIRDQSLKDEVPVPLPHFTREGAGCSKWSAADIEIPHRPTREKSRRSNIKHYNVNDSLDRKKKQLKKLSTKISVDSPPATLSCDHYHFDDHNGQRRMIYMHHPVTNICTQIHQDSMSTAGGSGTQPTEPNIDQFYSKNKLCKNFAALIMSHIMITAALIPLFTMQSSLSLWGGSNAMGTIHNVANESLLLALLFSIGALSAIYAPFYVQYFGVKSCFIECYVMLSVFISSHYFPNVYILTLTHTVYGLFVGILSHSKIQFLMTLSNKFSILPTEASQDVISAQFSFLRQLSRIYILAQDIGVMIGATLTYFILHSHLQELNILHLFQLKDSGEKVCGSTYCPVVLSYLSDMEDYENHVNSTSGVSEILTTVTNTTHVDKDSNFLDMILPYEASNLLLSIYLAFTISTAIMSILFIDKIKSVSIFKSHQRRLRFSSFYNTHFSYIDMAVKDSKLQLTAPLSLFIGLEQGFMYSDFMKSYVACLIGAQKIPLILLSTSSLQCVAALTFGLLLQHVRRLHIMIIGAGFQCGLITVLVLWIPEGNDGAVLYAISAAWGVCSAIWQSLVFYALIDLYPENWSGPFAHSYFFRYVGLALSFGLQELVCNTFKFYVISISLGLAIVSYGYLEYKLKKESRVA